MHPSLERLLKVSGLNQEELAKRIDESPQTVSNWKDVECQNRELLKLLLSLASLLVGFLTGMSLVRMLKYQSTRMGLKHSIR